MKKILCVIRASTVYQETESQKQELIQFCLTKGFTADELDFIEVAGASARKCNPAYIKMLEDIKDRLLTNPHITNVALWHLNRLGRVESKLHEMKEFFVKHSIQVYIKEPSITLLDDNGELSAGGSIAFSVYASMVKYETDEMFAKMNRGKERQKALGKYTGGVVAFGYRVDRDKNIIIEEQEANIIRTIFSLYASDKYSLRELTEEVKERGFIRCKGGEFTYWNLLKLLSFENYCGTDIYPAIITKEQFDLCTAIRKRKATAKFSTAPVYKVNLAVGILKCGCGCNYVRSTNHYLCSTAASKFKTSCGAPSVKIETAHQIINLIVRYGWLHEFLQRSDTKKADIGAQIEVIRTKITVQQAEVQSLNARKDRLEHAYYVEGKLTETKYNNMVAEIDNKVTVALNKIQSFNEQLNTLQSSYNTVGEASVAQKMYQSLFETRFDECDKEQMKNIKAFANGFIKSMTVEYVENAQVRKMKETEIKVTDKYGNIFVFRYSPYIAAYKKDQSPLSMLIETQFKAVFVASDEPWLFGSLVYNKEIENAIHATYGLPVISGDEFRKMINS